MQENILSEAFTQLDGHSDSDQPGSHNSLAFTLDTYTFNYIHKERKLLGQFFRFVLCFCFLFCFSVDCDYSDLPISIILCPVKTIALKKLCTLHLLHLIYLTS